MGSAGTNSPDEVAQTFAGIHTESGGNLPGLVEASPVLLVFLRHFGCSFCRQAISDVADLKGVLDKRWVRPVFVHLGTPERAKPFFDYSGIGDVERVSDPEAAVYQLPLFALPRMHPALTLFQLLVWMGWLKGALFKHGLGRSKKMATRCRASSF